MSSLTRVPAHTSHETNQKIEEKTKRRVEFFADNPEKIEQRLMELNDEWDVERTLATNSSIISLFGLVMGFTANRKWFLLPLGIQSFFLQHALQGWCPPLPLLRRMGFRTADEINMERTALKVIRGDFEQISQKSDATPSAHSTWSAVSH